jgi:hypothetical protein
MLDGPLGARLQSLTEKVSGIEAHCKRQDNVDVP